VKADQLGFEPMTCQSQIQCLTAALPRIVRDRLTGVGTFCLFFWGSTGEA